MPKKKEATAIAADYDYATTKVTGKDGKVRHTRGNDDAVARAMIAFSAGGGDWMKVVRANKLQDKYDPGKFSNMGLFRMSLGNTLRALVRAGTPVVIGDVTVKTLEQRVAIPEVKDKPARKRKAKAEQKEAA